MNIVASEENLSLGMAFNFGAGPPVEGDLGGISLRTRSICGVYPGSFNKPACQRMAITQNTARTWFGLIVLW